MAETQESVDPIDRKILRILQQDGRIRVTDLAHRVGLSKTPCTERMRRLERDGYVCGFHAEIDPEKIGLTTLVFVQVTLERTATEIRDKFNASVRLIPEVEAAHMVAGGYDYLLKVRTRDMTHYRQLLGNRIGTLPGVSQTHTYPVMESVKDQCGIDPSLI